jgi:stage II sporulation protein D
VHHNNHDTLSRRGVLTAIAVGIAAGGATVGRAFAAAHPVAPDRIQVRDSSGAIVGITLEEYVKGVVGSELPPTWPAAALRAQAVAARTYAVAYLGSRGYVCSTTDCQVWNPGKRNAAADVAVDATRGQILTYQDEAIWAYYSSTCGGQTAAAAAPYCKSVRCWIEKDGSRAPALDLRDEGAATSFWAGERPPAAFCDGSSAFRFGWTASGASVAAALDRYLAVLGGVTPRYASGQLGELRDLSVAARAASGKATRLRVAGPNGAWEVGPELSIRSGLRASTTAAAQRSANLVLSLERDGAAIARVSVRGGGYGHGAGLCQHGAKGMADRGLDYQAILKHYYDGVELTTL